MPIGFAAIPRGQDADDIGVTSERKGGLGRTNTTCSTVDVLKQDERRRRGATRARVGNGLDRFVTQTLQRAGFLVVVASRWCSRIGAFDQLEIGPRTDQVYERRAKLPDRLDESFARLQGTAVAEVDGNGREATWRGHEGGIGGQVIGSRAGILPVEAQYLSRMFHRVHDLARQYLADRMQLELEGSDDPEIATSTAHAPEQVGVLAGTGSEHPSIGRDEVHRQQIINGQAVLAHEPAQAAAQRQARQASSAYGAGGRGESIGLRCLHKLTQGETCLNPGRFLLWIDADAFHAREIDDHAAIADGTATDAVPTTAHSYEQVVEAPELDGSDHIDYIHAAHDHGWVFVDHPVPDPAGCVIATVVRADQFATQRGFEVLQNDRGQCVRKHACCSFRVHLEGAIYPWSGIAPSCCIRANPSKSPRNSVIFPEARR